MRPHFVLITAAILAGCAARGTPESRFDRLIRAGRPVSPNDAARRLGADPVTTREEALRWRARAAAILGRSTESGYLVFDAPSLAPSPADAAIERKKPDAPPLARDRKVRVKVRLPDGYAPDRRYPLIVFLHGSWTAYDKARNFWEGTAGTDAIVAAVDSNRAKIDGAGWNHYPEIGSVLSAVREMKLRYAVDPARVFLFGHSNGVGGIFRIAAFWPDGFAGIAAFSSVMTAGLPEERIPLSNWGARPVFQWQGAKDENGTSLVDRGRAFSGWLKEKGFNLTYLEDPEGTHRMTVEGIRAGWDALRGSNAPRNPRAVSCRSPVTTTAIGLAEPAPGLAHTRPGRCHWLAASVIEKPADTGKDAPPPMYAMKGTVDGNAVSIETRGVREIRLFLNDALVDLDAPVTVTVNGRAVFSGPVPRSLATLAADILERACPEEAADAVLAISLD